MWLGSLPRWVCYRRNRNILIPHPPNHRDVFRTILDSSFLSPCADGSRWSFVAQQLKRALSLVASFLTITVPDETGVATGNVPDRGLSGGGISGLFYVPSAHSKP